MDKGASKDRPIVICHMLVSTDGRVTGDFLSSTDISDATDAYYRINRELMGDAFACGRVTMDESFAHGYSPVLDAYEGKIVPQGDYIADFNSHLYAISFDRCGRLGWQSGYIRDDDPGYDGAHIVEVLCEELTDRRYLAYLRQIGVSYIFAGKKKMDISVALEKLRGYFGIRRLLLEGGSIINRAFLDAGVIDQLSLVVARITAEATDYPLFFGLNVAGGIYPGFEKTEELVEGNYKVQNYIRKDLVK